MATLLQQETQIRATLIADIDDNIAPSEANYETNAVSLMDNLNAVRSQLSNLLDDQAGDWYDDLNIPSALDTGTQRGVNNLNTDLHALERARRLVARKLLVDITVGGADNFVVLGVGELPTQLTAAVGAVTTLGTVVAFHTGSFGTNSLDEVSGAHALAPKNLVEITDGSGDPLLSSGRRIWGLLQSEVATDGHTINTTTQEIQISFVRPTAAHTDLEACPAADIQGQTIRYCSVERIANEDLTEQDFMSRGAAIDIGAGAGSVTRQVAYDNQGATAVDLTTNGILDLEGPGLAWRIRDDLEAMLFEIVEGSAGGTSQVNLGSDVDEFDVDAAVNNFLAGITIRSGGAAPIDVGVTDGHVETTAGDLSIQSAAELFFDDVNQAGSTWAQTDGIKLSETTAEWDAFETAFGEVSLLNAMVQAKNTSGRRRVYSVVQSNLAADVDVSGPSNDNNLDADLGDLSAGTFVDDYDIYHNGQYLRLDAADAGPGDVYPGTALANGQLRFNRKLKSGDTLCVVDLAE